MSAERYGYVQTALLRVRHRNAHGVVSLASKWNVGLSGLSGGEMNGACGSEIRGAGIINGRKPVLLTTGDSRGGIVVHGLVGDQFVDAGTKLGEAELTAGIGLDRGSLVPARHALLHPLFEKLHADAQSRVRIGQQDAALDQGFRQERDDDVGARFDDGVVAAIAVFEKPRLAGAHPEGKEGIAARLIADP